MKAEEQIASRLFQKDLIVTARGTTALWLALRTLNPSRRGVLVPANVCEVVIAAILYADMEPIYVDVDPIIGTIGIHDLEATPCHDAGALIAVHHFGSPLPMEAICKWAYSRDIFVIEDACNALGALAAGRPAGTWGDAAIYSFGEGKIMDVGHGGALAARAPDFLEACRRRGEKLNSWSESVQSRDIAFQACLRTLRQYGELKDPVLYRALYQQYKPALLTRSAEGTIDKIRKGLDGLSAKLEIRRRRADYYRKRLNLPGIMHRPPHPGEVFWRYTFHLAPNYRDGAVRYLRERGLPVSTWYPAVDRFFRERPSGYGLPGADLFERTVINLWVEPKTTDDVVKTSAASLLEYLSQATFEQERPVLP